MEIEMPAPGTPDLKCLVEQLSWISLRFETVSAPPTSVHRRLSVILGHLPSTKEPTGFTQVPREHSWNQSLCGRAHQARPVLAGQS